MSVQNQNLIKDGFHQARAITGKHAKTFFFASHFLPQKERLAAYSVYAICRLSDDSVDRSKDDALKELSRIEKMINDAYSEDACDVPIILAFRETAKQYDIPKNYFDELIKGLRMDLTIFRYETFDSLYLYCYRVAGVVGLIMLKIFSHNKEAEQFAIDLGIAMQLTNILRDVKEDLGLGRIYLPQDEMDKFEITEYSLINGHATEQFIKFYKFQINRARHYYRRSSEGINLIGNKQCRLVVRLMKNMYAGILSAIERNHYDIFSQRAHVNTFGKIRILLQTISSTIIK